MNQIYRVIGTTRQNVHQRLNDLLAIEEEKAQLLVLIDQVREDHPRMGAKILYQKIHPLVMGRDRFIAFYNEAGYKLRVVKNYRRTTDSSGVIRFPNLTEGIELTGVNQAFGSDITYYEMGKKFYYLTFITDLYSRKIKGYSASRTLKTVDTTIPAIKMVLKGLKIKQKPILHSDGGGQYYCKEFLKLTGSKFKNSMCKSVYENAHAERINGIIKNDYIKYYAPENFRQLVKMLNKAVCNYNTGRPHQSLAGLTPEEFEQKGNGYTQKIKILTKEKSSKKEKYNGNNKFVKKAYKTVNLI